MAHCRDCVRFQFRSFPRPLINPAAAPHVDNGDERSSAARCGPCRRHRHGPAARLDLRIQRSHRAAGGGARGQALRARQRVRHIGGVLHGGREPGPAAVRARACADPGGIDRHPLRCRRSAGGGRAVARLADPRLWAGVRHRRRDGLRRRATMRECDAAHPARPRQRLSRRSLSTRCHAGCAGLRARARSGRSAPHACRPRGRGRDGDDCRGAAGRARRRGAGKARPGERCESGERAGQLAGHILEALHGVLPGGVSRPHGAEPGGQHGRCLRRGKIGVAACHHRHYGRNRRSASRGRLADRPVPGAAGRRVRSDHGARRCHRAHAAAVGRDGDPDPGADRCRLRSHLGRDLRRRRILLAEGGFRPHRRPRLHCLVSGRDRASHPCGASLRPLWRV